MFDLLFFPKEIKQCIYGNTLIKNAQDYDFVLSIYFLYVFNFLFFSRFLF